MKRFSLVVLLAIFCSLPAFSQFWIHVEWGAPHCRHCEWMEEALRLPPRQAAEYHRIIHKYGERIEREARKEYRYWDKARYEHDYWFYRWIDMRPDNFYHGQQGHSHPGYSPRYEEKRPPHQANKGGKEHPSYQSDRRQQKRDDRYTPRSNDRKNQKEQKQSKSSKERLKVDR